jgi:hypothetical protein
LQLIEKEDLYQTIKSEAAKRGLLFESIAAGKGVEFGFAISMRSIKKVYGNILSPITCFTPV